MSKNPNRYRRDYIYFIIDFGALKRKNGESISYFIKRFNKLYGRIPDEIKPTKYSNIRQSVPYFGS